MTAARIVHGWTRRAEMEYPNPGKIADPEIFTADHDWATGRLISDAFIQHEPDSQERNAAVYLFGYVIALLFAVVPILFLCLAGGPQ